ncbi:MAG: metallophosphoesterase [Magnetococcus sp. MYC-9]
MAHVFGGAGFRVGGVGLIIGLLLGLGVPAEGWAKTHYHWVQLIEGKKQGELFLPRVSVRAIVDQTESCPTLYATADTKKGKELFTLKERPKQGEVAKGNRFATIKVCEHVLQPDDKLLQGFTTGYLADDKQAVPVLLPDLSRGGVPLSQLITSGCTGCRDGKAQYCSEQAAREAKKASSFPWLYKELNDQAATDAGEGVPPLWVHLGDMRYSGQKENVADSWEKAEGKLGWKEEVFEPAARLMAKSLVVMLRGNHEGCFVKGNDWDKSGWKGRGEGWFYFFGAGDLACHAVASKLNDALPPFAVDGVLYGGTVSKPVVTQKQVRLVMMDFVRTGDGRDKQPDETKALFKKQFSGVAKEFAKPLPADKPLWIFVHEPVYELDTRKSELDETTVTKALQGSDLRDHLSKVAAVVSAHKHQFNLIRAKAQPTQITVGNGGVALSGRSGITCEVEGKGDLLGLQSVQFGYLHARFVPEGEQVQARYEMPLFKPEWGGLKAERRVTCTGDGKHPWRLLCPKTANQPTCKDVAAGDDD